MCWTVLITAVSFLSNAFVYSPAFLKPYILVLVSLLCGILISIQKQNNFLLVSVFSKAAAALLEIPLWNSRYKTYKNLDSFI